MNWQVLLPTAAAVVVGIIGYLMKRSITAMDQKIDGMSTKLDESSAKFESSLSELRKEFYAYKDWAVDEFAREKDFIHATSDIGKKIDKVYDILLDLKGRVR